MAKKKATETKQSSGSKGRETKESPAKDDQEDKVAEEQAALTVARTEAITDMKSPGEPSEQEGDTQDAVPSKGEHETTELDGPPLDAPVAHGDDIDGGVLTLKQVGEIEPRDTDDVEQAKPDGRIIGVGEKVTFDADDYDQFVIIKEDVYQEHQARGSARKTYTLLFAKGTRMAKTSVQSTVNASDTTSDGTNDDED
jgi:hypothetical protein